MSTSPNDPDPGASQSSSPSASPPSSLAGVAAPAPPPATEAVTAPVAAPALPLVDGPRRPTLRNVPPPVPPFRDDDRVAPLGASADAPTPTPTPTPTPATVAGGDALRGRVLAAIKDAVAAARAAATRAAIDPAEAVHEVRKALRRMRALVDAVAPELARDAHKALRKALIEARRTLGPARDRTVAHGALGELPAELADHARALIGASTEQAPQLAAEIEALTRAVAEADAQAVALAAALPDELRPGRIARGLTRTYAGARRARRKARHSERATHRWRRRSKELGYQLALLGDDAAATELGAQLTAIDADLGPAVDHLLLKDWVGLHGGVLDGDAVGALLAHTHDQLLAGRDRARAASKPLFSRKPRKLRKLLRRALRGADQPADADADADGTPDNT